MGHHAWQVSEAILWRMNTSLPALRGPLMNERRAAVGRDRGSTAGAILAILLAVIVLLGAWFFVLGGGGRPSITVNTNTDNAVPTVELRGPAPRVAA